MSKKNYDVTLQKVGLCTVEQGGIDYAITLTKIGSYTVMAENVKEAMDIANSLSNAELDGMACWCDDSPEITDIDCKKPFDRATVMKSMENISFGSDISVDWFDTIATDAEEEDAGDDLQV